MPISTVSARFSVARPATALMLLLLVAACGPSAAPTSAPAAPGGPTITMHSEGDARKFEPATLTVPKGSVVTWKHSSGSGHTATTDPAKVKDPGRVAIPPGATAWDSGTLSDGRTWSTAFTVPGTYKYVCLPHEDRDMVGTIVVSD